MATKRDILSLLKHDDLLQAADRIGVEVDDRRRKDGLVEALGRARRAPLEDVLAGLSRDRLKGVCRDAGLDDRGNKAEMIGRLVAATNARRTAEPATGQGTLPLEAKEPRVKKQDDTAPSHSTTPDVETTGGDNGTETVATLEEGKVLDFITGQPVKDTPKEQVLQRIARAFFHEYTLLVEDMARDFKLIAEGRRRKIDLVIFEPGSEHTVGNIRRMVVCQKEPKVGSKGAFKMRSHEQAKKEFELLHTAMAEVESCRYGLWTNGLEFFFFDKEITRFDVKFHPIGDWPMADESLGTRDVVSQARLRRADANMLRTTFRRCHNFIHGNEGMPKDAAFWQFLYLIFAKMHDEKRERDTPPRFWAGATEQFDDEGRKKIRARIEPIFEQVKKEYDTIFRGNEEITLSDRALAFMVSELAKYDFGRTDIDAKGAAYQEIVGNNLRGDRGQYFTPRGAIKLMVEMLDPKPDERVLDPACGTGGFLVATINHWLARFQAETKSGGIETTDFFSVSDMLKNAVEYNLFGADFDPFLVRATTMNLMMAAGSRGNTYHMDSLSFPKGHLDGVEPAIRDIPLGSIDVLMTNPPFGSDIPITDDAILDNYDLAAKWEKDEEGIFVRKGGYQRAIAPEVLFVQRSIDWLRPGGRMGIVLPDGILGNPRDEYIRAWILRHCWVLASVDLPVETFIADANVNILTSLLFLKKKTPEELKATDLGAENDYQVFMAVAEKVGVDRRGNILYKRSPDGEEIVRTVRETERIRVNGNFREVVLYRKEKIVDDDLPRIAEAYREFRADDPEPGR